MVRKEKEVAVVMFTDRWKTLGVVFSLVLLACTLAVVLVPEKVVEVWEKGSIAVYQGVGGGMLEVRESSEFSETAISGEFYDRDTGKVYECSEVVSDGKSDQCKNPILVGELVERHIAKNIMVDTPSIKNVTFKSDDAVFGSEKYVDVEGNVLGVRFKKLADKNAVMITNVFFEDGEEKSMDEMKSLNPFYTREYIKYDGVNNLSLGDFNRTSIELHFETDNIAVPLKVDGQQVGVVDYSGSYVFTDDNVLEHNYTLGFKSSTFRITSGDNSTFFDARLSSGAPSNNYGTDPEVPLYAWITEITYVGVHGYNLTELLTTSKVKSDLASLIITNHSFIAKNRVDPDPGGGFDFIRVKMPSGDVLEGTQNGAPGNCSWDSPNNTFEMSGTATWTVDPSLGRTFRSDIGGEFLMRNYGNESWAAGQTETFEFDTTAINNLISEGEDYFYQSTNGSAGQTTDFHTYSKNNAGNEWGLYFEWETANNPPTFEPIDDIEKDEDFSQFTIDLSNNISDDSDSDADLEISFELNETDIITIDSLDNSTNVMTVSSQANASGVVNISLTLVDTGGLTAFESFDLIVNAVNDAPWWDEIVNGSSTKIKTGYGYQPLDVDASYYFRDVEDDQTPDNITISVNESGVDCFMNTDSNFSIFCSPNSVSVFIITLVGEDSGANTVTTSFEEHVIYPPSTPVVNIPIATVYQGNITLNWDTSVSPQGDEIAFYNLTINDTVDDWYYSIAIMNSTSYSWDTRELQDFYGYYFQVEACDNNSLCTAGGSPAFNINNTPHWSEIGNTTADNIFTNLGKQPVLSNVSVYFHDYFDDQTPSSIVVGDNETSMSCTVETNLSLFCTPTFFEGDYTITLNGTNSVGNSSFESFEGFVTNTPPTVPTVLNPEDHVLNDTATLNISCSGSTDTEEDTVYYDYYGDTSTTPTTNICLNAGTECLWNNTNTNQWVYWYCQSNDTWENSTPTTTRSIRTETWDVIDVNQSSPATASEGETIIIESNISWNEIRYTDITARLNYSGTVYTPTKTSYDNYTNFFTSLNVPDEDSDTTQYFNWTYNLTYKNDSVFQNTSYGGSVSVSAIYFIENCTGNATDVVAVNFSFWQENGFEQFDFKENDSKADIDAMFIVYKDDITINSTRTFSYDNISYFTLCIPENEEYKSLAQIDYIASLYDRRQYYFINQTLNNQTENINLYLLEISLGSGITFNVEDATGNEIENGYLYTYRYDPGTDTYHLVSMGLTDGDGEEYLYLRKFDAFYKFEVWKDGVQRYEDEINRKINDDSVILRLGDESKGELLDSFDTISYTLTNTTDSIVLTYSDTGTKATQYCLTVYKTNASDEGYVCETCKTIRESTISCDISGNDGIYIANAWANINHDRPFATLIVEKVQELFTGFGKTGLFGAFLIILTLGCIGVYIGRVHGVVVGVLVGLFISKMLGMMQINYATFIGFVVLGIIISVYAKN